MAPNVSPRYRVTGDLFSAVGLTSVCWNPDRAVIAPARPHASPQLTGLTCDACLHTICSWQVSTRARSTAS